MNKQDSPFKQACVFVIKLGVLAHQYGTQSKRLEFYLSHIIKKLGYNGIFRVTPNEIFFNFTHKDTFEQKTHFTYRPKMGFNLFKLNQIEELITKVLNGKLNINQATNSLNEIKQLHSPYGQVLTILGYMLAAAGFAGFLQCSLIDIIMAPLLSILVYIITRINNYFPERFETLYLFICSFSVAIVASLIQIIYPQTQVYLITLSAIIYLIPGFAISSGIMELSYRYVISGLINITNGLTSLLILFAGAWAATAIINYLHPVHTIAANKINSLFIWPSSIIMSIGLAILLQIPKKEFIWALLGSVIACAGILLGEKIANINLGNMLGSLFVVLYANVWTKYTKKAQSLVLLPAFVFLVSGSIGFRGITSITYNHITLGTEQFLHMFYVAGSIAAGFLIGNIIYKPKYTL